MDVIFDPRKREFLNSEGADKPLKSPLSSDILERARAYRLGRLRSQLYQHDCAAILLYDPVNIRYATDSSNMQLWTLHNAVRYALVFADGPVIVFEFKGCEHLSDMPGVDQIRRAIGWIYMSAGDRSEEFTGKWADEIADLMREHGGGNRRLAMDKVEPQGFEGIRGPQVNTGGRAGDNRACPRHQKCG